MQHLYIASSILSIAGLFTAYMIAREKRCLDESKKCLFGTHCQHVIRRVYGRHFGLPVELFVAAFYSVMALISLAFVVRPDADHPAVVFGTIMVLLFVSMYSIYLAISQFVAAKQPCTWTLIPLFVNVFLFLLWVLTSPYSVAELTLAYRPFVLSLHGAGFVLGVGSATISDLLFLKFLKDRRISQIEAQVLQTVSELAWVGLVFTFVSGYLLISLEPGFYLESGAFLVKLIAFGVILLNAIYLNGHIMPHIAGMRLRRVSPVKKMSHFSQLAFASVSVSFVSWYFLLILSYLNLSWTFTLMLGIYISVLAVAIFMSQLLRNSYIR